MGSLSNTPPFQSVRDAQVELAESVFSIHQLVALARAIPGTRDHTVGTFCDKKVTTDDGGSAIEFQFDTGKGQEDPWFMLYAFPGHKSISLQLVHGTMNLVNQRPITDLFAITNCESVRAVMANWRDPENNYWQIFFDGIDFEALSSLFPNISSALQMPPLEE